MLLLYERGGNCSLSPRVPPFVLWALQKMKIEENTITFESSQEKEICILLLSEVDIKELRPELYVKSGKMLDKIINKLEI